MELFATTFRSLIKEIPLGLKIPPISPPPEAIVRRLIYRIVDHFRELGVTTLLISESPNTRHSRHGVAEFVVDGIIRLESEIVGKNIQRNLAIIKMRETSIEGGRHSFEIGRKGIKIVD